MKTYRHFCVTIYYNEEVISNTVEKQAPNLFQMTYTRFKSEIFAANEMKNCLAAKLYQQLMNFKANGKCVR
jgi:REP element-mobilizing transposase RayT